ncbi:SDR family oxidoreductase [Nocardia sp. NPDC050793]|uniref:SDR family oxidoreductase n=1 Tax=Nocardia sp. NPDC050793 TaxID=3155159 RepID=UPI00340D8F2B
MTSSAFGGKHIVVTGGSSGIGQAAAWRFAKLGAQVTIIARREDPLAATASAAPAAGRIHAVSADVTDRVRLEAAIESAERHYGTPDLLLCCAGTARAGYFGELRDGDFHEAMDTNYFGTLHAVQAVLPAMCDRGSGHLVLVGSGAALLGLFGYTAYGPSKFAVRGLAESLRAELAHSGVRVSIVYPPDVDTPQLAAENRTKPSELRAVVGATEIWSADQVAERLIRGVVKGSFVIPCGGTITGLLYGHSILAPGLFRLFDRRAARARKEIRS